jgi:hypothetical protein
MKLSYQVIERDVSGDASAFVPGTLIPLVQRGNKIRGVAVITVDPVTQPIRLHFGSTGDPWPVSQDGGFSDDGSSTFDEGLYYSIPASSSPAIGTTLTIGILFAGGN